MRTHRHRQGGTAGRFSQGSGGRRVATVRAREAACGDSGVAPIWAVTHGLWDWGSWHRRVSLFLSHVISLLRRPTTNEDTHACTHTQASRRNDSPALGRSHQCWHRGHVEAAGMGPGVLRATTMAVAERSLCGTRHPSCPNASGDPSSPLGLVGALAPHVSPGSRSVLPAGPSQSPTSDRRRCPLRRRRRPSSRSDGDVIPGELPRRFPHAVPERSGVLRLPPQLPRPRGHGGSARQDPSPPDPVSHASQRRAVPRAPVPP